MGYRVERARASRCMPSGFPIDGSCGAAWLGIIPFGLLALQHAQRSIVYEPPATGAIKQK
jgi:hypothetical protein